MKCYDMVLSLTTLVLLGLCCHARGSPSTSQSSETNPIVATPLGKYRGTTMINSYGNLFFAFRGIPYAEPPIGELRFKPPAPIKKHAGIIEATKEPASCPQPPVGQEQISEDCLFINVYTSKIPSGNEKLKRPVLVFIHAGDFSTLSSRSDLIGPNYFMNRDNILVTFNYRLGVLGFISTGNVEAPGNNGLKDQVEALKWVKANIESFGGDPNSVTIYGIGSSATCVNLHLVSPLSQGLFHRAIMSSGSAASYYPMGRSLLQQTKNQAELVGCPINNSHVMIECLKTISADKLGNSIHKLKPGPYARTIWQPVIEGNFGQEQFLTEHPVKLMLEGKFQNVPIIAGYNSDQYSNEVIELIQNKEKLEKLDKEWNREAPKYFLYAHDKDQSDFRSKELRSFYFGDKKIDNSSLPELIKIYNDALAGYEMNRLVKLITQKSKEPLFYYYFSKQLKYSFFNPKEGPKLQGPVLYDDIIYILPITKLFPLVEKTDPDFKLVETFSRAIENFMKTGKPTDIWKYEPYNNSTEKYLISVDQIKTSERLHSERFAELEKLFPLTKYDVVEDTGVQE